MATQGSQDVKIFSSVRPLQIQRSFEGQAETTDVGLAKQDISIERSSTVTITAQTSSTTMSTGHAEPERDIIQTHVSPVDPATVTVNAAASPTAAGPPTSPGTILIRSSAAGAVPVTGAVQNVMIIKPIAIAPRGPTPTVVIKSSSTQQTSQTSAQSKIVISPAPIAQSRITVSAISAAAPAPPQNEPEVVVTNGPEVPVVQATRSALTIKTTPSPISPNPVNDASPQSDSPVSIQPQSASIHEGSPSLTPVTPPEHFTPEIDEPKQPVAEHRIQDSTSAPATIREDLSEKVHQKKPSGPSTAEVLDKISISSAFLVAFAILVTVVACIVTEGEVPLSWILAAISAISLVSFVALRL